MAIKTTPQGEIPSVTLEYNQTDQFSLTVSRAKPYTISVTAKVCPYGKDLNGDKVFSAKNKPTLTIPNVEAYIQTKVPEARQAEAITALTDIQRAIGVLYDFYYGDTFLGVE